jgi:hypothetical protein
MRRAGLPFNFHLTHFIAQKCDKLNSKTTFAWVKLEIYFPEFAENYIQMLEMLPLALTVYIEVINEYLQKSTTQILKDF